MGDLPQACLTLPCFNEAERLDLEAFRTFAADNPTIRMVFVDDGSDDPTFSLISELAAEYPNTMSAVRSPQHVGKAGAVRIGLQAGIAEGAEVVGYFDADLATPLSEVPRLLEAVTARDVDGVLGSRVGLLGYDVQRTPIRHYMGRVFATVASRLLGLGVYDTQCGAKVFRVTPGLVSSLERPFESRWTFDVELLMRLRRNSPQSRFVEVPLHHWSDVPGSKLKVAAGLRAGVELLGLWLRNRSSASTGGL